MGAFFGCRVAVVRVAKGMTSHDRTDGATPWAMIALLWTAGLLTAAQFAKMTLTLDALGALYPDAPVALVVSGISVVGIVFGALAGFFVANRGIRPVILWAIAGSAVVSFVQALPMSFLPFMATRIVEGVGHLSLVIALPTMMASLAAPRDRSVVMGLWGTFFGVGYALLAVIVPAVEAKGGVAAVYGAHGLLLAAILPVLAWSLPKVSQARVSMPAVLPLHKTIYSTPRFVAPAVGHGIYTSVFIALVAFLPSQLDALWLTAALPVANLLGTFAAGFLARVLAASRLAVLTFAAGVVLFALLGLTGSPAVALLALGATGLTAGANFAAVPEFNTTPEDQARANGAMAQLGNIGTFTGTPLYAVFAGGLWGLAGLSVAICVFGVVCAGWAYARARMSAMNA